MKYVLRYAARLGITVHAAHLEDGVLGEWYEEEREIYVDLKLTPDETVFTIAHELGHAHNGDRCEGEPEVEERADVFAAQLLIEPARYAQLERDGIHRHDIAEELGVAPEALDLWLRSSMLKLRGITYVKARMGVGQWLHREQSA
ncbi:ImmA/IrrE family metallo-endopeptidase [Microbacterium sp. CFBP 13617]|nr:ImmA/IrrE family metallo-endopeptidase [Microbacterium sp. CFBP 13617]MBD8218253.1 ImmA/IrrE family metallo-endopeptidase [Microbacterium sp. CFBP 13617]